MLKILTVTIVTLVVSAQALPTNVVTERNDLDIYFNAKERIAKDGYHADTHYVTTSDGYILEVIRIPFAKGEDMNNVKPNKPTVFLMHGLQGSALSYIALGPQLSLPYNLVEAGYDVWMGNARGVINSRNHVRLDPDDPEDKLEFFDYTYDDVASKDLPAMIDYVLEHTKNQQLHYIGHSQGGTAFLVLNSLKPEYNEKFKSVNLLAGVGYMKHFPNRVLSVAARATNLIYAYAISRGSIEIFGPKWNTADVESCENNSDEAACVLWDITEALSQIFGPLEMIAGASIKQYAHYGQNIKDKAFRRWDYGPLLNLWHYRAAVPPAYDISLITADVTMHYALSDALLDEQDVLGMAAQMPNAKVRKIPRESFTHTDFVTARDSKEFVTDPIIEALNAIEKRN